MQDSLVEHQTPHCKTHSPIANPRRNGTTIHTIRVVNKTITRRMLLARTHATCGIPMRADNIDMRWSIWGSNLVCRV